MLRRPYTRQINEEKFIEKSQQALDDLWEAICSRDGRDLPVDSPSRDSSPIGPEERDTNHPVQS